MTRETDIFLTFTDDNLMEYEDVPVRVSLDRDGDVFAECLANVYEKAYSGNRREPNEVVELHSRAFCKGEALELNEEQMAVAREAIREAEEHMKAEVQDVRNLFRFAPISVPPEISARPTEKLGRAI